MTAPTTPPPEPEAARVSGEGAAIIFRERLYAILRAIGSAPEPTHGLRIGMLSFNESVAYDAIVELVAERIAYERHALATARAEGAAAERERCAKRLCRLCHEGVALDAARRAHFIDDGLQPKGTTGRWRLCRAAAILDERGRG